MYVTRFTTWTCDLTVIYNYLNFFEEIIPAWTDSAPHAIKDKESACGCAGIYNAPVALESYATVFEEEGALDKFEAFASEHGPRFYGLPLNAGKVTLERTSWKMCESIAAGSTHIVPFHAGATLRWKFVGSSAK